MLWYCSTRAPRGWRTPAVIGDGSAKWKIVTSPARDAGSSNAEHLAPQIVVHRQGKELGRVAGVPEHVAHAARTVADRVAAMGGGHPLVHDHARDSGCGIRGSARRCRACEFECDEVGLRVASARVRMDRQRPDTERGGTGATLRTAGTVRTGARSPMRLLEQASAGGCSVSVTNRSSVAGEVAGEEPLEGRILRLHDGCFDIGVADHRIHECARYRSGSLVS